MYRLMIADDEDEERRGIRFLLGRCGFSFEIMEAVDGRDALEKLGEFPADILMTDVKMPFMDGIALATEARKRYPGLQLIFFSGYDDFDYVKKALSLQAVDYILKPVNPEEFQKTIATVRERIARKQDADAASLHFQQNYVLARLLNKTRTEKLHQEYKNGQLSFADAYTRLLLMEFEEDFFGKDVADVREFLDALEGTLTDDVKFLDINPSQAVFFLGDAYRSEKMARSLAEKLGNIVRERFGHCCYLAVSPEIACADGIGEAYEAAEAGLENRFFYRDIYVYPLEKNPSGLEPVFEEREIWRTIEKDIACHDCYSLRKNVEIFLDTCRGNRLQSYIYTRFVCANLLRVLFQGIPQSEGRLAQMVEKSYGCGSFAELEQLVWSVVDELEEHLQRGADSPKHTIALVERYIREHYAETLSLDILADKVYLTPHYLSSMFIQEKGIGVNKYIKNVRMEKARELLLETNMKISEICEKTGYSNLSYFCRSFRNEYGKTPEQYWG